MKVLASPLRLARSAARRGEAFIFEALVRTAARSVPAVSEPSARPRSIFVLRNNDVGDLLVVTPLFAALRARFPEARIAVGVGTWNLDVLRHNPHVSEVLPVNAPWFNKYQEAAGPWERLAYIRYSPEVTAVARRGFEIGIDVLGSGWGALLLLAGRIPFRMGVRGYAGGHSAVQIAIPFDSALHVGRAALRFAEALGATELPPNRPQIFLTRDETEQAERWWRASESTGKKPPRVILGPGGGLEAKRWPRESFAALAASLAGRYGENLSMLILGGPGEKETIERVASAASRARAFLEPPGLRQVFALVAACDLVICNSSMLLHVAAAFGKKTLVLLGPAFPSADAHQKQWGYPGLSVSLGRQPPAQGRLCTPEEALDAAVRDLPS